MDSTLSESVLATSNADGRPQSTVIFVKRDGEAVVFSTIKGRSKTPNVFDGALLIGHMAPGTGQKTMLYGCYAMFGLSLVASLIIITVNRRNWGKFKRQPTK